MKKKARSPIIAPDGTRKFNTATSAIPGFGLSIGITVTMLSFVVLIPLASIFWSSAGLTLTDFVATITRRRVLMSFAGSIETALIASMQTNDEEILAAALLHDTIEDTGVTYEDLKQEFGTRVAAVVAAESEDKSKTWIERKGHTLEHLKTASQAEKILTMADKLSNIRSMARDYLLVGEELWQRFNMKDKEKQAWYYTSMIDLLKDLNETPEYQEYVRLCGKVFGGIAGCCSLQNI